MSNELRQAPSPRQVSRLSIKAKIHQAQAAQHALQAKHYQTIAHSCVLTATSHQLLARRRQAQAEDNLALQLNYELQAKCHMLQAQQCRENFMNYRLMAMDSEKRALAHQMLAEHLAKYILPS